MLDPDLTNILKRRIGASLIDFGIIGLITTIVWRTQLISFPITDRDDITGAPLWNAAQQAQRDDIAERLHTSFVFSDTSYVIDQTGIVLTALCALVMALLAFVLVPANAGWSPGQRILGLAITDHEGNNPPLFDHVKRSVVGIIDFLPIIIPGAAGWLFAKGDEYHRRLGDRVAGTYVIDNRNGAKFIDPSVYKRRTELRRATPVADDMVEISDRLSPETSSLRREDSPELPAPSQLGDRSDAELPDYGHPDHNRRQLERGGFDRGEHDRRGSDDDFDEIDLGIPAERNSDAEDVPQSAPHPRVDPVGDPSVAADATSSLLPDLPAANDPEFQAPTPTSRVEAATPLKARDLSSGQRTAQVPDPIIALPDTEAPSPEIPGTERPTTEPSSTERGGAELRVDPGRYEPSSAPMPTHRVSAPTDNEAPVTSSTPTPEPESSTSPSAQPEAAEPDPDWEQPVPEPAPVWQPGKTPDPDTEPATETSTMTDPEASGDMVWNDQWQAWLFWDAEHEHWLRHDLESDHWIPIS